MIEAMLTQHLNAIQGIVAALAGQRDETIADRDRLAAELATVKALCREAAVYVSWLPVEGCPCGTCNEIRDFLARLRGEG